MIHMVHEREPERPPSVQRGYIRTRIGDYWVDYTGDLPTLAEVNALHNPPRRRKRQLAAIMADIQAMSNADRTRLFAGVAAFVLAEHPGIAAAIGVNVAGDKSDE